MAGARESDRGAALMVGIATKAPAPTSWLSTAERAIHDSFKFEKRRNDWTIGRWTAKNLVQHVLGIDSIPLNDIEIIAADDGAPEAFVRGEPIPFPISISHSGGYGFAAVSRFQRMVGCDIEQVEPRAVEFFQDYFSEEEKNLVRSVPAEHLSVTLNCIWSAKESCLKALRVGLREDPRHCAVWIDRPLPTTNWTPISGKIETCPREFQGWWRLFGNSVLTVVSDDAPAVEPVFLFQPE